MNLKDRLARLEARARRTAAKGDERHHEIDEAFDQAWQVAQDLQGRIATIETNTARIDALVKAFAEHMNDKKAHKHG